MASSLFSQIPQAQKQPQAANNPMQIIQKFQQFRQEMAGKDPEQILNGLLQSGKISESQFENLKNQAQTMMQFFKR